MTKKKIKELVSVIIVIGLLLAVMGLISGISSSKTKTLSSFGYTRGCLDSQTGEFVKSDTMLVTEDAFACQGLSIESDFTSNTRYEIYYYREDNSFIGKTDLIKGTYNKGTSFLNAKYARIVLQPDVDEKIPLWDILKHADDITVSVSKDQSFEAPLVSAFTTVMDDYIREVEETGYYVTRIHEGPFTYAGDHIDDIENKTVRKISIPVAGVADYTKDCTLSVYVVEGDGTKAFRKVNEIELVIPAFTFESNLVIEDWDQNEVTDGAEAGWYTFECDIKLGDNQTLAFSDADDTVYSIYRKTFSEETCKYPLYNLVTNGTVRSPMYSIEIYYDVEYLE